MINITLALFMTVAIAICIMMARKIYSILILNKIDKKYIMQCKIAISIWLICTIASIILDVLVKAINDISVAQSLALIGGGIKIIGLISLLGIFVVPFFKHNENQ